MVSEAARDFDASLQQKNVILFTDLPTSASSAILCAYFERIRYDYG